MADGGQSPNAAPSVIPMKRALEDDHVPAVSSPLNPSSHPIKTREPREKKDTLKKREAKGESSTPTKAVVEKGSSATSTPKKSKKVSAEGSTLSLIRYTIPRPQKGDFLPANEPILVPITGRNGEQFYDATEHVFNRKGYRYIHCIADPGFPFIQYHRQTEVAPYGPRFDYEDASSHIRFNDQARGITTEKGFRMARANVCAREGRWYWECRVTSGIRPASTAGQPLDESGGHVRIGFSRREASLDTPVGFDAYSYGLRDMCGQTVHMSRPADFFPANENVCEGDVIGLEINLPSLALHKKVVDGIYNKAVDLDEADGASTEALDIIRDRLPIRYKSHLYFEQLEYTSVKELEDLTNPAPVMTSLASIPKPPFPNHQSVSLRTLPDSYIKVYKNGKLMGKPFKELLAFLPPASKPAPQGSGSVSRDGLDDGMLGYFPAVSVFRGGAVETNFGPDFWFPPDDKAVQPGVTTGKSKAAKKEPEPTGRSWPRRPLSERYAEQIAEDVVADIIDEVDLWMFDDGKLESNRQFANGISDRANGVDSEDAGRTATTNGQIREVVQDDE